MQPTSSAPTQPAWSASLGLTLGDRAGRTRIRSLRHHGPLRIQRAFHPEGDGTAHVVVLHPPAGLVGGDRLDVEIDVEEGARALVTTTGAGKTYRSDGRQAETLTSARVSDGAYLELVPQETVVFDGAHAGLCTSVSLAATAELLAWEVICLGRPACGERFDRGRLRCALEVSREGHLLFSERGTVAGGDPALDAPWGFGGLPAFGTLVATAGAVDALRVAVPDHAGPAAVTRLDDLRVVRVAGRDGVHVRAALERARHAVRDAWRRPRLDPAIWRS